MYRYALVLPQGYYRCFTVLSVDYVVPEILKSIRCDLPVPDRCAHQAGTSPSSSRTIGWLLLSDSYFIDN